MIGDLRYPLTLIKSRVSFSHYNQQNNNILQNQLMLMKGQISIHKQKNICRVYLGVENGEFVPQSLLPFVINLIISLLEGLRINGFLSSIRFF
ncbi:hypothetical protein [Metabacillus litoralis]|uniref:hypothetical protein n=1 Tax=Metabacillus litoralis TaxID=152268 RepID=UPI001CFD2A17|nr:hypothetical protein [Metabacillus litoralis]